MTLIDRIWQQIEHKVFISKADFVRSLEGWTISPVEINGKVAIATKVKGPEFHFISFDTKQSIPRRVWIELLQPIIDQYGFVETMTPKDDERQQRFNKLIGFTVQGETEFFIHFRAEKLRFNGAR